MRYFIRTIMLYLLAGTIGIAAASSVMAAEGRGAADPRIQATFDAVERGLDRTVAPIPQVEKSASDAAAVAGPAAPDAAPDAALITDRLPEVEAAE